MRRRRSSNLPAAGCLLELRATLAHNDGVLVMIAKYNPQVHALNRGLGELTRGGQGAASFSFSIGPFLVEEKPAFIQSDPSEVMCNLFRKAWPHAVKIGLTAAYRSALGSDK